MAEIHSTLNSDEILEILKKGSFDAFFVVDRKGTIVFLSEAYAKLTGKDPNLLIGRNASELRDLGILETSAFERVRDSHQATTVMLRYSISEKEALVTAIPIFKPDGEYYAMLGNIRDLSELNQLKRDLNYAQRRVRQAETWLEKSRLPVEGDKDFIAESPAMRKLAVLARRISQVDATVLITGESGVGKDVYANYIKRLSLDGASKPFVKISCGAIPENLLESELFGYAEGAFTGAKKGGKPGAFEMAGDGIVFLDEVGEMPLPLQVKLLTVIQDRQFRAVGGTKDIKMRARIVAATNRDLEEEVREGAFRKDLYYRLNVIPVEIPPLRERREDIVPLVLMIQQKLNDKYGSKKIFSPAVIRAFEHYDWPGNVRELVNVVERMMALSIENEIDTDQLPDSIMFGLQQADEGAENAHLPLRDYVEQMERHRIALALRKPQTFAEAARELGIDQSTLTRKMQKYHLQRKNGPKHIHDDMSHITIS